MKLNEIVLLELDQADFLEDARKSTIYFDKEMEKIFPRKSYIRDARMPKYNPDFGASNFGASVDIDFADRNWKVTIHNSDIYLSFYMHLTDAGGRVPETMEKFVIDGQVSRQMKLEGIKYRKISAKSPMDAMKKLVAWFGKNKAAIKTIEELQKNG